MNYLNTFFCCVIITFQIYFTNYTATCTHNCRLHQACSEMRIEIQLCIANGCAAFSFYYTHTRISEKILIHSQPSWFWVILFSFIFKFSSLKFDKMRHFSNMLTEWPTEERDSYIYACCWFYVGVGSLLGGNFFNHFYFSRTSDRKNFNHKISTSQTYIRAWKL